MDAFDRELAQVAEQGSENWVNVRVGRFTASEMWKLCEPGERPMTPEELAKRPKSGKGAYAKFIKDEAIISKSGETYIKEKVVEVLTGVPKSESYAYPLVYGKEMESQAREYFESKTSLIVNTCGFITYSDHAGGSPDGLIGDDALIEIKSPYVSVNQLDYLDLNNPMDLMLGYPEYFWQVHSNLLFTGRKLAYFITYDPRFQLEKHKMKILEVPKDEWAESLILEKLKRAIEKKLKMLSELR